MGRRCWRRRALAAACLGAALLLLGECPSGPRTGRGSAPRWAGGGGVGPTGSGAATPPRSPRGSCAPGHSGPQAHRTRAPGPQARRVMPRRLAPHPEGPGERAFENSLSSGWLSGKRRSPLQMLYDLDQGPRSALAALAAEHRQRRDLLRRACSRHTRRQRLLRPEDLRHVLVDDAHGLLYCYVPRAACTSWKRVLLALSGRGPADPRAIPAPEAHAPGRLPSLADFGPAEINRRLRAYLAFLFVREPFERLASAYRSQLARGHDVRFAEFLAYLLEPRTRRDEPLNEPWERAHALCHPCRLRYHVLGKFETLAEDAAFVLRLAGAPHLRFPAPPPGAAAAARRRAERLFRDVSPFYQRRLFDLYRMDFLLFNYSAPAYVRLPAP
ncbi:Carbohydrate sulfotransferase 13 [Vulpes lagopus]